MHFESIKNKIVLLRCDFNEPIKDEFLESTKRIDTNIITIHELLARKNKVILISHHSDTGQTMLPIFNYLKNVFKDTSSCNINYINSIDQGIIKNYFNLNKNTHLDFNNPESENIILLENTRLFGEDLDESNDLEFAKFLASLADCYVYDAFSVGHREHASTSGVAKLLPSCFGPTFLKEYNSLKKITDELDSSLIFMGGAKLSTKLPMVNKFLDAGAIVCLGGAMTHLILKNNYLKNKNEINCVDIKDSYIEKDFELDENTFDKLSQHIENKNLILPKTLIWNTEGDTKNTILKNEVKIVDNIFDFKQIEEMILNKNIKNILWNGPVGMYENQEVEGSSQIYSFIKNTDNDIDRKIFSVLGGGDTLTLLEELDKDFEKNFSYVSLSGGAMLEFLSTGTLPMLKVIKI